jgi:hypothetical protein
MSDYFNEYNENPEETTEESGYSSMRTGASDPTFSSPRSPRKRKKNRLPVLWT